MEEEKVKVKRGWEGRIFYIESVVRERGVCLGVYGWFFYYLVFVSS